MNSSIWFNTGNYLVVVTMSRHSVFGHPTKNIYKGLECEDTQDSLAKRNAILASLGRKLSRFYL